MSLTPEQQELLNLAIEKTITEHTQMGLEVLNIENARPWGGFVQFRPEDALTFTQRYFPTTAIPKNGRSQPKIMIVLGDQITSVQYHLNRDEYWVGVDGEIKIHMIRDNTLPPVHKKYLNGNVVFIPRQWRHSTLGVAPISRFAEIWHEPDPNNPTDEITDNYRVFDFYGRPNEGVTR